MNLQTKVFKHFEVVPQVQDCERIWVDDAPPVENQRHPGMAGVCLIQVRVTPRVRMRVRERSRMIVRVSVRMSASEPRRNNFKGFQYFFVEKWLNPSP